MEKEAIPFNPTQPCFYDRIIILLLDHSSTTDTILNDSLSYPKKFATAIWIYPTYQGC